MLTESDIQLISADLASQFRTNVVGWVSYAILIYDHIITFGDEVEYIWKGKKAALIYLFFINRYLTPLVFVIQWFAYFSPVLGNFEKCDQFAVYEGVMFAVAIYISSLMMFLRIRAMYRTNLWIQGWLIFLIVGGIALSIYDLTSTQAVRHHPDTPIQACYMIFGDDRAKSSTVQVAWPLIYDSFIVGLTLYKTLPSIHSKTSSTIINRLFKDGIAYYFIIFCMALTLTVMVAVAEDSIKNVMGQVEQLLTVALMSRITLSLKRAGSKTTIVYFGEGGRVDRWDNRTNYTTQGSDLRFGGHIGKASTTDERSTGVGQTTTATVIEMSPIAEENSTKGSSYS